MRRGGQRGFCEIHLSCELSTFPFNDRWSNCKTRLSLGAFDPLLEACNRCGTRLTLADGQSHPNEPVKMNGGGGAQHVFVHLLSATEHVRKPDGQPDFARCWGRWREENSRIVRSCLRELRGWGGMARLLTAVAPSKLDVLALELAPLLL